MKKTILDGLTNYFYFSLQDRKGIILLSAICLLIYFLPIPMRIYTEQSQNKRDFTEEKRLIEQLALHGASASEQQGTEINASNIAPSGLFAFDPNIATKDDFVRLGLSAKTAQTIENYRAKGGKFKKPADFAKIWSISKTDFDRLLPYIDIPSNEPMANSSAKSNTNQFGTPTPFDPNTATEIDLKKLGLPDHTIKSIVNFRSKGGKFRSSADFKKIYTLSEKDFLRLEPFVSIEAAIERDKLPVMASLKSSYILDERSKSNSVAIDINIADELDWQKLKGIGPALSKRIVGYRSNLGGFYAIEQVAETYNLPDSTFQKIRTQLKLSQPTQLSKININTATETELSLHPYIGKKEAKWIVAFRQQHGNYRSIHDVLNAFPKEDKIWLAKVEKYLEI